MKLSSDLIAPRPEVDYPERRLLAWLRGECEHIGKRQHAVLMRARGCRSGLVMSGHYLEERACRRLAERYMLRRCIGWPGIWAVTEFGRACWLHVQ